MTRHAHALVLCADTNGLGAVRSLTAAGVPTTAVVLDAGQPVLHSRHGRKVVVPATDDPEAALLDCLRRHWTPGAVILPTSDWFARFLNQHRDALTPEFALAVPPADVLAAMTDKAAETALIARLGVALPRTVQELPAAPGDLARALGFPLIIKPRSTARRLGWKTLVCANAAELEEFYRAYEDRLTAVIAQEFIPGADSALWVCDCTFDAASELVGAFTFQKIRTSPPHNGVTSFGRSARNEAVIDLVRQLGRALGYVGPADVDLKYDHRDGSYKYIELNPRLGMCNAFATACGVNVAYDAYRVAAGLTPPAGAASRQAEGRYYLSLFEDLYSRYQDGESLLQACRDYGRALPWLRGGAFFSWRDPWPALQAAARDGGRIVRGIAGKCLAVGRRLPTFVTALPRRLGGGAIRQRER